MSTSTPTAPRPKPWKQYPDDDDRADYAAGLRHLADLVEQGRTPIPFGTVDLFLFGSADDQAAAARDLRRALGGGKYRKDPSPTSMTLEGMCGGVPVRIYLDRSAVCERVVVGTEKVEVPAQPAVQAHTETREIVEWRCAPLLAATDEDDSAVA